MPEVPTHVLEQRLGRFIAYYSQRSGKTRIEVASHVGVAKQAIERVEKADRTLGFVEGLLLFEALEIPPQILMGLLQGLRKMEMKE